MSHDSTRDDSELGPAPPPGGLGADVMKANIAAELFGDVVAPLQIGRYEVGEAIGQGAMGLVYAAWDPALGRRTALKVLSAQGAASERRRARQLREAQALAKLSHPNVVQVYEVGDHDGNVFLAMELIEGPSLREWLRRAPRSTREIEEVFLQAGRGLAAAHARDLVHRDFKPNNVLVGDDGRTRVVDFGLAHGPGLSTDSAQPESLPRHGERITQTGAIVGTPAYMAPEQFHGTPPDARADQFSFCVALFEALAGERPYALADLSQDSSRLKIRQLSSIPRRLRAPLRRGLNPDPGQRWPSMEALLRAITRGRSWARRARWLAVGTLGTLAGAFWVIDPPNPCNALPREPPEWNGARAERVSRSFSNSGAPYAGDVSRATRAELDSFVLEWRAERDQTCQATSPNPEAIRCLNRARIILDAVLSELEAVEPSTIASAHLLSTVLEPPSRCGDSPADSFSAEVAPEQLAGLSQARAALATRRADAVIETTDAMERQKVLDGTDALASALLLRAQARDLQGNPGGAAADFSRSIQIARGSVTRARSLVAWTRHLIQEERLSSAADALKLLDPFISGSSPPSLRADHLELRAELRHGDDEPEAMNLLGEALQLRRTHGDSEAVSRTRMLIANRLLSSETPGAVARGESQLRELLREREQELGRQHPAVAEARYNLAVFVADARDDFEGARRLLENAEQIQRRVLPHDSPLRARTRLKLGEVLLRTGELDAARDMLNSAWARLQALPPSHSDHHAARTLLAIVTLEAGEHTASLEHHEALAELEPENLLVHQNLAYLHSELGESEQAAASLARARSLARTDTELDPPTRALLELYFLAIDARIELSRANNDAARKLVAEIRHRLADYTFPPEQRSIAAQLDVLEEELADLEREASSAR